jgi:hypothetical protein
MLGGEGRRGAERSLKGDGVKGGGVKGGWVEGGWVKGGWVKGGRWWGSVGRLSARRWSEGGE